jgi:hypothetical protein
MSDPVGVRADGYFILWSFILWSFISFQER